MAKQSDGKALIWDLGNTLLRVNTFCYAKKVGLMDFILYPLLEWKNPKKVHEIAFDILAHVHAPGHDGYPHATAQGKPIPLIMCHWLAGTTNHTDLWAKIERQLRLAEVNNVFSSARQKRLVTNTLKILFDGEQFTQCIEPIKATIDILKECAEQKDASGNQKHQLLILSNWDPHSFIYVLEAPALKELFSYFDSHAILISGHTGILKPDVASYKHLLEQFHLEPKNCLFIDDQIENIHAAETVGIKGIYLQDNNFKKLRTDLAAQGII